MEDSKLLALHESLSKLRKFGGLGVSAQYSWQRNGGENENSGLYTTGADGKSKRTDGLPLNSLYNNFVKEGSYDPNQKGGHGDGRAIKRDFSDCNDSNSHVVSGGSSSDDDSSSDDGSQVRRQKKKARKEQKKAEKKAAKKAAKLEAKRQAKLEEKKRAKKEAKAALKRKLAEEEAKEVTSSSSDQE